MQTTLKIALLFASSAAADGGEASPAPGRSPMCRLFGKPMRRSEAISEQRAGCEIWFYATAGNGRFHTYVLPQRLPVLLNWYRVLNSKERSDRFARGASSTIPIAARRAVRIARRRNWKRHMEWIIAGG